MPVKLRRGSFRVAGTVFSSNWKYTENRMNPMIFFEQKQIAEHKSTRILFHSDLCWNKEWKMFFLYSVEHYANLDWIETNPTKRHSKSFFEVRSCKQFLKPCTINLTSIPQQTLARTVLRRFSSIMSAARHQQIRLFYAFAPLSR